MKLRRILLIVNPNRRPTGAYQQAVRLAATTGAELRLALFEHANAIDAAQWLNGQIGTLAKRAYLDERETWLRELCCELCERNLRASWTVAWAQPAHEAIVGEALAWGADLVVKDVDYTPVLRRLLFKPLDWQLLRLCPAPLWLVRGQRAGAPKRIVAAVDTVRSRAEGGELNDRIVEAARQLSGQGEGATVDLVHVQRLADVDPLPPDEPATASGTLQDRDAGRFETFAEKHGISPAFRHHLHGLVSDAVAACAAERHADLVVVGTTYRTGLQRILLGSMAELILSRVGCDVLALKPRGFEKNLAREIKALSQSHARRAA